MKTPLVLLLVCVAVAAASPLTTEGYQSLFAKWVNHHSKVYGSPDEMFKRYNIWRENLDYIMAHPAKNKTHTLAMNAFGDLSNAEFTSIYNNYVPSRLRQNTKPRLSSGSGLPDSVDWVASGAVTPIKNQGQCGSCWSFSTTGAIEGINFITNNQLISLSEQELVDCSGSSGTEGCNGGDMGAAMGWVASNGGLCTEQDYPYTAVQGTCQTTCTSAATISGSQDVTANSEDELQNAVAQQPVSVAVDAGGTDWQFYSGGVLSDSCGTDLDHGVLAVGYGNLNGVDHWKVKNSWGASWGAAGYIYLQRGSGSGNPGQCGIAMEPVYPVA